MISCFVLDDESSAVDLLCTFITGVPFLTLTGSSTNALDALAKLCEIPVDLIFLDIHMPQLSGLEFMRMLPNATQVILTTAYRDFAIEGFRLRALDYLLKPIAFERFVEAAQRALPHKTNTTLHKTGEFNDHFFVKTIGKGKWARVNINEVASIESKRNYLSILIDTTLEPIITLLNIKDVADRLPKERFMRVHKSYIISLNKIIAIDGNQILLKDQKNTIPLGDTYRNIFFETLKQKSLGE